jgi:hypothetical protein
LNNAEDNNSNDEERKTNRRGFWAWRNEAYIKETEEVPRLLFELCQTLKSPPHDSRGPKPLPLSDKVQCMILKVFFSRSSARTVKLLEQAQEKGRFTRTPKSNSIIHYFNLPELTPILHDLIGRSSKPMIPHETWFAFDGTPFAMRDYLDYTGTYTADRANGHRYIMLQTIAGLNTRIVPAAAVDVCLEQYFHMKHDSQFVEALVRRTSAIGFKITALWGDKAYDSHKNRQLAKDIEAEDHLTRRRMKGNKRKSEGEKEQSDSALRVRNGVETVYSMIKQIFGGSVSSRNEVSLVNEALSIVIAHNLRVLVHYMLKHEIEIKFEAS